MLIFLFLSLILSLTHGQTAYSQLSAAQKRYVDMALDKANREIADSNGHLNFNRIGKNGKLAPTVILDVLLKNTECAKEEVEHKHRPDCPFKRLEVHCRVCGRPGGETMFIDCARLKDLSLERFTDWNHNCPECDGSCGNILSLH